MLALKKVTLKKLQELSGHLSFACHVLTPGTAFMRWLCGAIKAVRAAYHRVRVMSEMRKDLRLRMEFLKPFNGLKLTCF